MVQSSGKLRNFFKTKHAFNHITQQLHFWAFPRERKMYVRTKTCTQIFTEALFVIVKTWKQSRCPLMGECLDKLWCIQVVEYYSAIKRNETYKNLDESTGNYTEKMPIPNGTVHTVCDSININS